jgi:hypothetical protein
MIGVVSKEGRKEVVMAVRSRSRLMTLQTPTWAVIVSLLALIALFALAW